MTTGALLFAIDSDTINYTLMAKYCAINIKKHINIPVSIVTNKKLSCDIFDKEIIIDFNKNQYRTTSGKKESWNNFGRYLAYELSPYDNTLLLDCDYIVNSNQLTKLFDMNYDLLCHRTKLYPSIEKQQDHETFGRGYDMYWATVVYFNKSNYSKSVFEMMKMIQNNYHHYSKIYGFQQTTFRNDFALSIAIHAINGNIYDKQVEIPWKLFNVEFATTIDKQDDIWELKYERRIDNKTFNKKITVKNQDVHILNKNELIRIINETGLFNSSVQ